jgi:lipopolysaccharide export LptBFGC system permease protein LptF
MQLDIQYFTLFYSFLFGIFYEIGYLFSRKALYHKKKGIKIFSSFFFCFLYAYLYYLVMEKVNNGIIHPYGILVSFLSIIMTYYLFTKKRK